MLNTKDRILLEALDLFSKCGYSGVTMEDIGTKVGIKAPSIYKHYKSKDMIFSSILEGAQNKFNNQVKNLVHNNEYIEIEDLDIEELGLDAFDYFYHDDYISKVRKMLSIEMYRNPNMTKLYIHQYIELPLQRHLDVLEKVDFHGDIDLHALSLIFYSPIYMSIKMCDAYPEREEEVRSNLENTLRFLKESLVDLIKK